MAKANPGGQVDLQDVIGRDPLIARIWDILDQQSVIMTAERRIGKTTIIRKMCAQPRENWIPVLQDLEQYHSADAFTLGVFREIEKHLSGWGKSMYRARRFLETVGGIEVTGVKLPEAKRAHWKTLLTESVADLVEQQAPKRLVFFWDEMPYMLESIRQREGEATAIEVLDILRFLRQTHARGFRIVSTGSIGLHHVLTRLRAADYRNEPVNDMYSVEVTPLALPDARELARRLLDGERIDCARPDPTAGTIAEEGDCFPFYIHHIVRELKNGQRKATTRTVRDIVQQHLCDANDPWELGHYRDRIATYYPADTKLVETVLDSLGARDEACTVDELLAEVGAQMAFDDRNRLLAVLRLLERDHYLARDEQGRFRFRFPLIRRWWRLDRGL